MKLFLRPLLMGILNVTPDSFSDGGTHTEASKAIEHGARLVDEGADLIDVGGESTRPGAEAVPLDEELKRVLPVVEGLAARSIRVSVDTRKAAVAKASLKSGASVINDVTALSDPDMARVCAEADCTVCLMHMRGEPVTMQQNPGYEDVVAEVKAYLLDRAAYAQSQGIAHDRIWIDPGIGFGKTDQHNLLLLKHLDQFVKTGFPVLIGVSRKGFIGRVLGGLPTEQRQEGTLSVQVLAQAAGAKIVRAHDVKAARRAIDLAAAILNM